MKNTKEITDQISLLEKQIGDLQKKLFQTRQKKIKSKNRKLVLILKQKELINLILNLP